MSMTVGEILRRLGVDRLLWWWDRWGALVAACIALAALGVAGSR